MTRSITIGCITQYLSGPYNGVVIGAIAEESRQLDTGFVVFQGSPSDLTATGLARDQVDGWICLPPFDGLTDLYAWGRPIVLVSEAAPEHLPCTAVLSDNRSGVHALVRHLWPNTAIPGSDSPVFLMWPISVNAIRPTWRRCRNLACRMIPTWC